MTCFTVLTFCVFLVCVSVIASPPGSSRQGRFFTFMSMIKFTNEDCVSDNGDQGVCNSAKKCSKSGGVTSGSCANGYGSCCVYKKMCSSSVDVVKNVNTHLVSPNRGPAVCRYELAKSKNVCQVRLDFKKFNIDQGSDNSNGGFCEADTFTISGATNGPGGALCGDLTDQHMYLDYGSSEKINIDIMTITSGNQEWDIYVKFIECNSPQLAPKGCLQYYTTSSGIVKSFNFVNKVQLNDQYYSICVQPQESLTKIKWSACKDTPQPFAISGPIFPPLPPGQSAPVNSWSGSQCYNDWVEVYGNNKFCGSAFNDATSIHRPFMLGVNFNSYEQYIPAQHGNCGTQANPCWGGNGEPIANPTTAPVPVTPIESLDIDNSGFCLRYVCTPY